MGWDNVQLNINGQADDHLLDALRLAIAMHTVHGVKGYIKDREKGLILVWCTGADKEAAPFPCGLSADEVMPVVKAYLASEEAEQVALDGWDEDSDHDGSNSVGWRLYAEDWGHVKTHYAICAIKRVHLWHGK